MRPPLSKKLGTVLFGGVLLAGGATAPIIPDDTYVVKNSVGPNLGIQTTKLAPAARYHRASVVSKKWIAIFSQGQATTTMEITREQYEAMGGVDGAKNNPTMTGWTFLAASDKFVFDTPSGDLENGTYWIAATSSTSVLAITVDAVKAFVSPETAEAAIAADSQSSSGLYGASSSGTLSATVTGSNTLLIAHVTPLSGTGPTSCTWNGSAMTQVASQVNSDTSTMGQYTFVGASGTQNIQCNWGAAANAIQVETSYSGVNQSATPDSSNNSSTVSAAPQTYSTTVVCGTGAWLFLTAYNGQGGTPIASTGSFRRQLGSNVTIAAFDSNATVGAGSQSMTVAGSGSVSYAAIISSFCPAATAAASINDSNWFNVL